MSVCVVRTSLKGADLRHAIATLYAEGGEGLAVLAALYWIEGYSVRRMSGFMDTPRGSALSTLVYLRKLLEDIARRPFRVRPHWIPGPDGGCPA